MNFRYMVFLKIKLNTKVKEVVMLSINVICTSLFLYTGQQKLFDHARFMEGLSKVEWIGEYAGQISWTAPVLEILIAMLILLPATNRIGLCAFLGLMIVFTIYILTALLWASRLPCHCGGVIETLSWKEHLWFNISFIALAIYQLLLVRLPKKQ